MTTQWSGYSYCSSLDKEIEAKEFKVLLLVSGGSRLEPKSVWFQTYMCLSLHHNYNN